MKKGKKSNNTLASYAFGGVFEGFEAGSTDAWPPRNRKGINYGKLRKKGKKAAKRRKRRCRGGICSELNRQG